MGKEMALNLCYVKTAQKGLGPASVNRVADCHHSISPSLRRDFGQQAWLSFGLAFGSWHSHNDTALVLARRV